MAESVLQIGLPAGMVVLFLVWIVLRIFSHEKQIAILNEELKSNNIRDDDRSQSIKAFEGKLDTITSKLGQIETDIAKIFERLPAKK